MIRQVRQRALTAPLIALIVQRKEQLSVTRVIRNTLSTLQLALVARARRSADHVQFLVVVTIVLTDTD
jgi:hypothetical protein